jgi:SAM-dependent methyltransferase
VPSSSADWPPDGSSAFGGHAALYARRRPTYPQSVFDALEAGLTGARAHGVDLGAGTGQATKELARRFTRVTAVEPDGRMAAEFPAIENVAVVNAAAEDAAFERESVDAVIAATSFHWMKQGAVTAAVHRWLRPGGVFFPFRYGAFDMVGAAKPVFDRHAALWAPFKDRRLTANIEYMKPVATAALFRSVAAFADEIGATLSPEEAAGLLGTTSFASAYARATYGDPEIYIDKLAAEFRACGAETQLRAPLKGAIAIKASD